MFTSIKVKFRPFMVVTREGSLYYQVIHCRVVRQIVTPCRLFASEWDARSETVVPPADDKSRRHHLERIQQRVGWDVRHLHRVISRLNQSGSRYTSDDVVREYRRLTALGSLSRFFRDLVGQYEQLGQQRTAETYATTLNSFLRFTGGRDLPLDALDPFLVRSYESWLRSTGVTPNTSSFYLKRLRAAYNMAVEQGLVEQQYPFKHVYTGKQKTVKRAVTLSVIRRVLSLDLRDRPQLDFARDMFLFSFYTRGMSFVDMSYLRADQLRCGYLVYRRHKTGQLLRVKWERPIADIVEKYPDTSTGYLLPIITASGDERSQYRRVQFQVNYHLHRLSAMAGIQPSLTMYVARHSWASIAKSKHVSESTISDCLGHDSERTTRIYLAELDVSLVDKANRKVLDEIMRI